MMCCVEIPNFIPFWTMKYFSFQSWIAMYIFFLSFFALGELEKFSILLIVGQWEWPIWKKMDLNLEDNLSN
jgi:hypothetical protein